MPHTLQSTPRQSLPFPRSSAPSARTYSCLDKWQPTRVLLSCSQKYISSSRKTFRPREAHGSLPITQAMPRDVLFARMPKLIKPADTVEKKIIVGQNLKAKINPETIACQIPKNKSAPSLLKLRNFTESLTWGSKSWSYDWELWNLRESRKPAGCKIPIPTSLQSILLFVIWKKT